MAEEHLISAHLRPFFVFLAKRGLVKSKNVYTGEIQVGTVADVIGETQEEAGPSGTGGHGMTGRADGTFLKGDIVRVVDLKARTDLNGQRGRVVDHKGADYYGLLAQVQVELVDGTQVALKPANLQLEEAGEVDASDSDESNDSDDDTPSARRGGWKKVNGKWTKSWKM